MVRIVQTRSVVFLSGQLVRQQRSRIRIGDTRQPVRDAIGHHVLEVGVQDARLRTP